KNFFENARGIIIAKITVSNIAGFNLKKIGSFKKSDSRDIKTIIIKSKKIKKSIFLNLIKLTINSIKLIETATKIDKTMSLKM
ncbi:MAG TPA: hypothetical protein PK771_02830, partial [Spirochaetota bacterium]|nr:hypothetical protein [Spirochaetota bacterium]